MRDDDHVGLFIGDGSWTYRQLVEEGSRRAALFAELRDDDRPPHVGVLLDNVADYLFWLSAAALGGFVIVGVNSTYRGDQLGLLVRHSDCQLLVTDATLAAAPRRRRHRGARRPRAPRRRRRVRVACRRATGRATRACRRRRRPLPPHLHVGLDRAAEGGAVHPGALRPHRRARGEGRRARAGRRRVRAAAVLPLERAVHRLVVGAQRRDPDRDPAEVLGVEHPARHPSLRRLDARVHRQGPELHPRHARAARRRRQPVAARARQRGVDPRHQRVRPALRQRRARQLRIDRGHHHHPPRPVDARRRARHVRSDA